MSEESFVGGFSVSYPNSLQAKYRFTWPLARLTVSPDYITLAPRGPFKYLMRPIVVRYTDILTVDASVGRLVGTIVFNSDVPELDGIGFGTLRMSGFERLVDLLRRRGVTVHWY